MRFIRRGKRRSRLSKKSIIRRAKKSPIKMTKRVNLKKDMHYFARSTEIISYQGQGTGEIVGSGTFRLNQLPNYGEFTTLFDRYKIHGVKLTWHLRQVPGSDNLVFQHNVYPRLFIVKDYDDSNNPANQAAIQEHGKCKEYILMPNRKLNIYVKPSVLIPAYRSGVSNSYIPKWNQWIDCADADVPHYGIKYVIDTFNTYYQLFVTAKFYMSFKDTR